tara:strand:+ start:270 stop:737 length:468 start_codon:yes stop_codon:yes gene_type:complete
MLKQFKTIITNVQALKMNLISARTVENIKYDEGRRLKLYKCPADKWTIGIGRNLEDRGITAEEADFLLMNDLKIAQKELRANFGWFVELNSVRQGVLLNMHINMGISRLKGFKRMIKALEVRDYERASIEILDSDAARELVSRYDRLSDDMRTGK